MTESSGSVLERHFLPIIALTALIVLPFHGWVDLAHPDLRGWDLHSYRAMALAAPGLADGIMQPFAFRPLVPWLAGMAPIDVDLAFRVIGTLATFSVALLLAVFLRQEGASAPAAWLATLAWLTNTYWCGYPDWNPYQANDTVALALLLLGYIAARDRRFIALGGITMISVLARETAVLLGPLTLFMLWQAGAPASTWVRASAAFVPAAGLFLALRLLVPSEGGLALTEAIATHASKLISPEAWLRAAINAPMPLGLLPLVYCDRLLAWFRDRPHWLLWIALVFLSTMFGSNIERLLAPVFMPFYLFLAHVATRERWHGGTCAIIATACVLGSLHHLYGWLLLPDPFATRVTGLAATLVVGATLLAARIAPGRFATGARAD